MRCSRRRDAFVDLVTTDQPDAPSYFTYDAVLNSQERPTLDETLDRIGVLTLEHVLALQAAGAQVLDTRDPAAFAAAHMAGTINIGLGGQYATWAGTVLSREHPWDLAAVYESLNSHRRDRGQTCQAVAREVRCPEHQLTGLRTARCAIGMKLMMRIVQRLDQPAAAFIHPARW
jgi:rhodanese-related sulfurtransferase